MLAADVTAEWFAMPLHIWTCVLSYPHRFYCNWIRCWTW